LNAPRRTGATANIGERIPDPATEFDPITVVPAVPPSAQLATRAPIGVTAPDGADAKRWPPR
jgi:hypothetical protein